MGLADRSGLSGKKLQEEEGYLRVGESEASQHKRQQHPRLLEGSFLPEKSGLS